MVEPLRRIVVLDENNGIHVLDFSDLNVRSVDRQSINEALDAFCQQHGFRRAAPELLERMFSAGRPQFDRRTAKIRTLLKEKPWRK